MIPSISTEQKPDLAFTSEPSLIELLSNSAPENKIIKATSLLPHEESQLKSELAKTTILGKKTALHLAISNGYRDLASILIELLNHCPELLAAKDTFGDTPLHLAIRLGNIPIAEKLISQLKGHPHLLLVKNRIPEVSPLYMAIELGLLAFATNFVHQIGSKLGSDLEPLKLCITRSFWDMALVLIYFHTVEEITSCDQLFHLSLEYPKKEISASLIDKLSKSPKQLVKPHHITGKTPLQVALGLGFVDVANHIIEVITKADPDLLTLESDTHTSSLHYMLSYGHTFLAEKYVTALGHNPEFLFRKDMSGDTPFIVAVKKGYYDTAQFLRNAFRDDEKLLSTKDYLSHTPLCIAKSNRDTLMTLFLEDIKSKIDKKREDMELITWFKEKNS